MLILQFYNFLDESKFEDYALQEISAGRDSHVVAIGADADVLKVMLAKQSEVPYGRDGKT